MSFKNITSPPYHFQTYWENLFDTPLPWLKVIRFIYWLSCRTYLRKILKLWKISEDNI